MHLLSQTSLLVYFNLFNLQKFIKRYKKVLKQIESKFGKIDAIYINDRSSSKIANHCQLASYISCGTHSLLNGIFSRQKSKKNNKKNRHLYEGKILIDVYNGIKDDILNNIKAKPASITIIYNGFDISSLQRLANKPNTNIPEQPFVMYSGRAGGKQKRLDILLKAYKLSEISQKLVILTNADQ